MLVKAALGIGSFHGNLGSRMELGNIQINHKLCIVFCGRLSNLYMVIYAIKLGKQLIVYLSSCLFSLSTKSISTSHMYKFTVYFLNWTLRRPCPDSNVGWPNVGTVVPTLGQRLPNLHCCLARADNVQDNFKNVFSDKWSAGCFTAFGK